MEKSFDNSSLTIQDADEEGRFKNQLNSTVIDDTSFLHPKIPKRDLKFSPILRPDEDDRRSVYWRRMAVCRSRGESPLAVPYSPLSSKENISRIDDTVATEFSETSTSDDTEKENCSFKTPSRSDSTMEIKRAVNPFHSTLLDSIHMNTFSPSLFAPMKTPENKSISLNIEERAILLPVEISQEDIERSNHYSPDPEFQAKLHASLDVYWQSNVGYVPSPDGPRPIVVDSPCSTVAVPHYASFVSSSPNCRPSVSRRKTVAKRNTKSQTELTIAPSIIFDFKSILGDNCVFDGTDEPEEEFNVSTMNTSLPRKLFSEELSLSSDWTSLEDVSDKRAGNQRRRVHITLELPWSADKAIQQFGRTHRSNQVSAPEYVFLISELAGEKRFASIVAKRLESLGALTHGDRRATESRDLSQFNLDNKYGRMALDVLLKSVIGTTTPLISPPADYKPGDFFNDMRLYMEGVGLLARLDNGQYIIEREAATIAKFLNRILGLPVHAQNALFKYFTDIVGELIVQAKHDGTYDMGIMDLGTGGDQVKKLETRVFLGNLDKGSFRVEMHKIGVERGVNWQDAFAIFQEHNTGDDGFYLSASSQGRKTAALVYGIGKRKQETGARLYAITRPSTGRSPKLETFADLTKRFQKVTPEEAQTVWAEQYERSNKMCQHSYVHGKCKNEQNGIYCEVGRRTRTYFVLSGSVLSVWPVVEDVLNGKDRRVSRMQVIRVRTDQEHKIVGLLVLPQFVRNLVTQLELHCGRCFVEEGNK